jgi:hypothetical protein
VRYHKRHLQGWWVLSQQDDCSSLLCYPFLFLTGCCSALYRVAGYLWLREIDHASPSFITSQCHCMCAKACIRTITTIPRCSLPISLQWCSVTLSHNYPPSVSVTPDFFLFFSLWPVLCLVPPFYGTPIFKFFSRIPENRGPKCCRRVIHEAGSA